MGNRKRRVKKVWNGSKREKLKYERRERKIVSRGNRRKREEGGKAWEVRSRTQTNEETVIR